MGKRLIHNIKGATFATLLSLCLGMMIFGVQPLHAQSQQAIDLTFESAVDIAMNNSYRVRQLQMGIERTRGWLKAERAGLKSRAYMRLKTPQIEAVSDNKWNSDLRRYEIVHENSRLWQMHTAIRQPVVLFGYPTNGYLSLNNTLYRYTQLNGGLDVKYYNRYFMKYEQPFFQPNRLKNNLEKAELNLEREELEFKEDIIDMVDDIGREYYQLFEISYKKKINANFVNNLKEAEAVASRFAKHDTSRSLDRDQVEVELANATEQLKQTESNFRLEASRMKQRLQLNEEDSINVEPTITITPIDVDEEEAIKYGQTIRPQLRQWNIRKRQNEINLENTKGYNSFRVNLEATVGREMQNPALGELWNKPTNSYSVGLNVYIPIWDWGRRNAQVQARQISLRKTKLYIEETQKDIKSDIKNAIQNLEEYEERVFTMQENLQKAQRIAEQSLTRYKGGEISILDLMQSFNRQKETANNFLDAYLGYRNALRTLQEETFYDFEKDQPVLDRFNIDRLQVANM